MLTPQGAAWIERFLADRDAVNHYQRLVNDTDEVEESRGCMAGLFNRLRRGSGDSDVSEASEMLELSTMGEFGSVELPIPLTNLQEVSMVRELRRGLAQICLFWQYPGWRLGNRGTDAKFCEVLERVRVAAQSSDWLRSEVLTVVAAQELGGLGDGVSVGVQALVEADAKLQFLVNHIKAGRNVKREGVRTRL